MKIAFLIPMLGGGGAERVTIDIARGLGPYCDNVQIIANEIVGEFVEDARRAATLHSLETYSTPKAVSRIRKHILAHKFDVLLAQGTRMSFAASLACLFLPNAPKVIWCLHNPYSTKYEIYPRPVSWAMTRAATFLANRAAKIIGVSDGVCQSFLHYFGNRFAAKTETIHNPIPGFAGKPFQDRQRNVPQKIVAVGRLERQKNFALLVDCMPLVLQKVDASLDIYGIGPKQQELQAQIDQLGLSDKVKLRGYSENVRETMAAADVFALSSSWEGLPTVLIEAMSTGVPVVSTDCKSGPDEILEHGKWGHLVPEDDSSALANAICDVLQSGGVDARARAKQFEPEFVIARYRKLLQSVTGMTSKDF